MDESKFLSQTLKQSETLGVCIRHLGMSNPKVMLRLKLGHVTVANHRIRTRNTILTEK